MASRHQQALVPQQQRGKDQGANPSLNQQALVPQQQRGAAAVPIGKQKAGAKADEKNRRALGDIGNVVNLRVIEGKQQPPIHRPVTRSFGAQLLANAHAVTTAAAANKKPIVLPEGGAAKGCPKAGKQKLTINPKPEEVIEISSETDEEVKQASVRKTSTTDSSTLRKKKVHTLTSVLTARSKAACGVIEKPKEPFVDIDAFDHDNELAVTDYIEDIYKFYRISERSSRPHDYMDSQVEINGKMRAIIADWLIEVHNKFELMPETLYLTFYIIDRYLSLEAVFRRELQLIGLSSMLIACKYEEIWAPEVNDFICISDRAYTREQILAKEKGILNKLEWNLTVPTTYVFLVRFMKAAVCNEKMEHMVFFFGELGLTLYSMIKYCPSMVAAATVYAAQCTLTQSRPLWSETLKRHTGFSESQLWDCAQVLIHSHSSAPESKLMVVYTKYSSSRYGSVALNPPATKLLEELKASASK